MSLCSPLCLHSISRSVHFFFSSYSFNHSVYYCYHVPKNCLERNERKKFYSDVNSLQLSLPRSEGCQTSLMRQILQKSINSHSLMFNIWESRHDRVLIAGNSTKHLIKISRSRLVSSSTKIDNLLSFASLFSFVCECFGWRSGDLWIEFYLYNSDAGVRTASRNFRIYFVKFYLLYEILNANVLFLLRSIFLLERK